MKVGANPSDMVSMRSMYRSEKTPEQIARALDLSVETVISLLGVKDKPKPESFVMPGLPKIET